MNTFVITGRVASPVRIELGMLDDRVQRTGTFTVYTAPPKKIKHDRTGHAGNNLKITVTERYAQTLMQILSLRDPVSITGHLQANHDGIPQIIAVRVEKLDALPCAP